MFKGLSMKQITQTFLEVESPTLKKTLTKASGTGVFLLNMQNFFRTPFYKTPPDDCPWACGFNKKWTFFRYFSSIVFNILADFFHRTAPSVFVVTVNRSSIIMLTIRKIIKSSKFPNIVFWKTMSKRIFKKVKLFLLH